VNKPQDSNDGPEVPPVQGATRRTRQKKKQDPAVVVPSEDTSQDQAEGSGGRLKRRRGAPASNVDTSDAPLMEGGVLGTRKQPKRTKK
jgi:hypothetical protein